MSKQLGIRVDEDVKTQLEHEAKEYDLSVNQICAAKLRQPFKVEMMQKSWLGSI